jgi:hypothetical protein
MNSPLKRRACPSSLDRLGDDRPHDGGPATYVARSVGIGVDNVSTPLTDELALRSPVGLLAMPALRTRLRSVGRIDRYQHDPGKPGLVFQEAAKLPESPLGVPTTLRPFQPFADAESDAFEVFEGYAPVRLFRLIDDMLAENVVRDLLEPAFSAGEFLQVALRRPRASLLKFGANALVSLARLFHSFGGVCLTVRVGSDIGHPKVNPEPVLWRARRGFLDFDSGQQIPLATPINEIGLAPTGTEQSTRSLITDERDTLPGFLGHGPDGHLIVVPTQDALIVGDGSQRLEGSLATLVELVGISDLCEQAYDHLRAKAEALFDWVVGRLLEPVLVGERLRVPCNPGGVVAGLVHPAKRRLKSLVLEVGREQLDHDRKPHAVTMLNIVPDHERTPKVANFGAAPFLPSSKEEGFLEQSR